MTELFIVGTSHTLQCGHASCSETSISAFRGEIVRLCRQERIKRIAEEMSADGLVRHGVAESIGAAVSNELKLQHQSVDLTAAERASLSLDDSPVLSTMQHFGGSNDWTGFREALTDLADAARERIWVARMLAQAQWPTLLICGSDHAQSVRRIFRAIGLDAKVVHRDYEP